MLHPLLLLVEKATRKFLPSILFKTRVDAEAGEERLKKLSLLIGNLKAVRKVFGGRLYSVVLRLSEDLVPKPMPF